MDYNNVSNYKKVFFERILSDIDSFNTVYRNTLFSQGFAKWYLTNFVGIDYKQIDNYIYREGFIASDDGYIVMTKSENQNKEIDFFCYIFNSSIDNSTAVRNSSTGLSNESFDVFNAQDFCRDIVEELIKNEDISNPVKISKLSFVYVTLAEEISIHVKKTVRGYSQKFKAEYQNIVASSNASFVCKSDIIKKYSNLLVTKNPESYNILGLLKSILKRIDNFSSANCFEKEEEARLIFLSMLSRADINLALKNDDSILKMLAENIKEFFDVKSFPDRVKYIYSNEKAASLDDDGKESCLKSTLYISEKYIKDKNNFCRLLDSFSDNYIIDRVSLRKITDNDIIYLKEKIKKISIPNEIKNFLFSVKEHFGDSFAKQRHNISDDAWVSLADLFRLSALLSSRKEVDYSDVLILENAVYSTSAPNEKVISKKFEEYIKNDAFLPIGYMEVGSESDLLGGNDINQGNNDRVFYIKNKETNLDIKILDTKVLFSEDDKTYTIEEARQVFAQNKIRLNNLLKKYQFSLKRNNYFTHRYDDIIINTINDRIKQNEQCLNDLSK